MDAEFTDLNNHATLDKTDFEKLVHQDNEMVDDIENTFENPEDDDNPAETTTDTSIENLEPGFASAYTEAKLNQANVASDSHFGDELTGLSHTEAKLFQAQTKPETETRLFLHGTKETHSRSLASTSFELEDNITNAFANVHVRVIRFWQSNALVVYPVVAICLIRRVTRYQKQRIGYSSNA